MAGPRIRTHYDNLKVARDAPDIVIRAAYRSLSQKYHPDKSPGDANAARIMVLINESYAVLSDPERRRRHDDWIAREEAKAAPPPSSPPPSPPPPREPPIPPTWREPPAPPPSPAHAKGQAVGRFLRTLLRTIAAILLWSPRLTLAVLFFGGLWAMGAYEPSERPTPPPRAAYVPGYPVAHDDGYSTVEVDNSQNTSAVFAKLVSLDGATAYPVRQFYIPGGSRFTVKNVSAGSYDLRYRDLESGGLARSEAFTLEVTATERGIRYSTMSMTLYKVRGGNMRTHDLAEEEF